MVNTSCTVGERVLYMEVQWLWLETGSNTITVDSHKHGFTSRLVFHEGWSHMKSRLSYRWSYKKGELSYRWSHKKGELSYRWSYKKGELSYRWSYKKGELSYRCSYKKGELSYRWSYKKGELSYRWSYKQWSHKKDGLSYRWSYKQWSHKKDGLSYRWSHKQGGLTTATLKKKIFYSNSVLWWPMLKLTSQSQCVGQLFHPPPSLYSDHYKHLLLKGSHSASLHHFLGLHLQLSFLESSTALTMVVLVTLP